MTLSKKNVQSSWLNFANKKSIFEAMVVAISDDNLYGVIN